MDLRAQLQEGLGTAYTLERELGRGGMATVFLAHDLKHDRPVALKVLHPELAATLGPERFQREIRLAARLQHPHILTVLDSGAVGQADGRTERLWFTMPYVEGESLRDRLRRERQLPVDAAIRIATEAARGLEYAHQHGVVHRDVKPENILLTRDGSTLVADFGVARALTGGREEARLTETGLAVGTPAYMSPEQAAADNALDTRTDQYSLAAVLYEMLAGDPPWAGATAQATIARRLSEPAPSVRTVRPTVPASVDEAIRKALSPVPADRFGSMAQFAGALQAERSEASTTITPGPAAAARPSARPPVRLPVAALALVLGLLVGAGVLFAWRRNQVETPRGDERRIAVLPFQNLGDTSDAYFADGITDAVRGKLTTIPGMRVTASNSTAGYRGTSKSPEQIGRELGVDYLLVGKVRWQKSAGGASRVQVSPELIEVATADAEWQQPFDAPLTDVFQVQADIAGRVAQALHLAIGSRQQQALEQRPTQNLAAYDAFLKGKAQRALGADPVTLRRAVNFFEQAVAIDSTFAPAWAALSEAASAFLSRGNVWEGLADRARAAADRAIALDPKHPDGYRALGDYYLIVQGRTARAAELYSKGLALAPDDADLLRGLGIAAQVAGRWEQAVEQLRRSLSLDPRSAITAEALGTALLWLRRYDEALQALDQALAVEPASLPSIQHKAMVFLARGDLAAARALLAEPPAGVDEPTFVAFMSTFWDLYWPLTAEQRNLVKRLRPSAFDGDEAAWGLALAGVYEVEGDMRRAAAYGDSAAVALEQHLDASPEDAHRTVLLGLALAYEGRKAEALRQGQRAMELAPGARYNLHQLARIYILTGEAEKAIDALERLLAMPYYLSPGWLRIDPTFDPIREHPRFRHLVKEGA
ncbi:MAG TPA: protein kinase [Gemmatimonadales bacterium]